VELDLSLFCRGVGVDVLHSDNLGHESNNLDEFFHLVDLDRVDYLLLQKLSQSRVDFGLQFGVFEEEGLQLMCQNVDELLCSCVLHGHLHRSCASAEIHEDSSGRNLCGDYFFLLEEAEDVVHFSRKGVVYVVSSDLGEEVGKEPRCHCEILLDSAQFLGGAVVVDGILQFLVEFGVAHVAEESLKNAFHLEVGNAL
jgi:hypothetical protein